MAEQFNNIELLAWDSSFFNYLVGKFKIQSNTKVDLIGFKENASNFKLVYIFSDNLLEIDEFKLADVKVVYHQNISQKARKIISYPNIVSYNSEVDDFEQLLKLALTSGIYSRFYTDSNFNNNEYQRLYEEWILKSVNDGLAFEILIYKELNQILGFLTLGEVTPDLAEIGLLAVSPESQGRGIASLLIDHAIEVSYQRGYTQLRVATQKNNLAANKLYTKAQFAIDSETYIYHYWNL